MSDTQAPEAAAPGEDRVAPGVLRAVLGKELLHGWRDRSVLILVFVVPLLLAGITTLAFGRLAGGDAVAVGVVDHDGGTAAQTLVYQVLPGLEVGGTALVTTRLYSGDDVARAAVRKGTLAAAIVIPRGLGAGIRSGHPPAFTLITGDDTSLGVPVAEAVLRGFSAQIGAIGLAITVATTGPGAAAATQTLMLDATRLRDPVAVDDEFAGPRALRPAGYFAPSMVVIALFFCGQIAARGLVAERRRRTLARLVLCGVPPWRIVAAKYAAAFIVGGLSAAVVLGVFAAAGTAFGDPLVLVVLVLAATAAMIGVSSLVVLVARTEEQAGSLGTTVAFVLAIVGGNFVPLSRTPRLLADLALATPNGWADRAFADLSVAQGGAWSAVAPALVALAGFALAAGAPALLLSRRTVRNSGV